MHLPHPLAVAGLVLNAAGSIGLLFTTRNPLAGAVLPEDTIKSLHVGMPKERRQYLWAMAKYRLSVGALLLGFILQLIDLLSA